MSVTFNHTIVHCRDQAKSSQFLADILGRPAPTRFGPFNVVKFDNGVSLDFIETAEPFPMEHYAFLISEAEFDSIFGRIKQRGLAYWADPRKQKSGEINHHFGGRGVYFEDPNGHFLEIITMPYGTDEELAREAGR